MKQKFIKGDIVMYKNRIHTILDILGLDNYELSNVKYPVNQAELSGVPLTPEILEKNGWEKRCERWYYDVSSQNISIGIAFTPFYHIAFIRATDEITHWDNGYVKLFLRKIKYISDLQHLLFGLGLNSEMEV